MKKRRTDLAISIALAICLMTACSRTPTAAERVENSEIAQETPDELPAEAGKSVWGDEELVSETAEPGHEAGEPAHESAEPATETAEPIPETGEPIPETAEPVPETEEPVPEIAESVTENTEVILGDEQFEEYLPLLEGKRVALFTNQTGIVGDETSADSEAECGVSDAAAATAATTAKAAAAEESEAAAGAATIEADATVRSVSADPDEAKTSDPTLIPFGKDAAGEEISYGQHILDALVERGVQVEAVFCPEHGFRGTEDAGAGVGDSVDEETGVPVISLYGSGKRGPDNGDMDRFDILVVDIQDVGLRYYTYNITMYGLMEACAAQGKEVLILDRPNPNGFYVDGPILQDEYRSGVGMLPIPVVHGMTFGELAQMINGEGWLDAGADACDLTVIPCGNYTHRTKTPLICRPSPNLRDMRAVYLYASTCFFENTLVSVGRGTENPFEIYGSPYLADADGFEFSFTPQSISGAANPPFEGETCWGVDLRDVPIEDIWDAGINVSYLVDAYYAVTETSPGRSFWGSADGNGQYWIDNLSGSSELRRMIEDGATAEEIKDSWQEDVTAFREQRRPYLLYEE